MAQGKRWSRKIHIQNKHMEPSPPIMAEQSSFSDEACRFLVETMEQGALCYDAQGRILMVNDAALTLLGLTRQQLIGQATLDPYGKALRVDGTSCPAEAQPANRVLRSGTSVHNEILGVFHEHDHTYHWLLTNALPQYRPGEHKPYRVFTLLSNFTPYKHVLDILKGLGINGERYEEHLKEFEIIFESVFQHITICGTHGRIRRLGLALRHAFHLSAEEARQQTLQDLSDRILLADEDGTVLPAEEWPISRMLRGEIQKNCIISIRQKDQPESLPVIFSISGGPLHDTHGAIMGAALIAIDITDQHGEERCSQRALHALLSMAEAMIAENQDKGALISQIACAFQSQEHATQLERGLAELPLGMLDCSSVGILLLDQETGLLHPAVVMSSTPDQELFWRNRLENAPLTALLSGEECVRALSQGELQEPETTLFADQPSYKLVAPILYRQQLKGILLIDYGENKPVLSADDEALLLGVARLASLLIEREQAQQERDKAVAALQDANAKLTLTNHMKSNFVSLASHELRTALASIQNFSETLRNEELSNMEVREFAIDIHEDAHRLESLINDMLDLDRLETSQIQLQPYWLDLNALINEAIARMRQHTQLHTFRLQLARALPILWGDREKLMLVLVNLLDNAIRYSPDGGVITVTSSLEDLFVHVSVSDQGVGIPAEELDHVFGEYKHIPEDARFGEGSGLGLSIVREIILLHGGKVWVESAPGIGSTFHFTLRTTAE